MTQLSNMAKNKQAMVDYYTTHNQSLEGYPGPGLEVDGLINNLRSMASSTPGADTVVAQPDPRISEWRRCSGTGTQ